jgi:winged helix-turn helix protein
LATSNSTPIYTTLTVVTVANALEGMDRATAARLAGMDRQTLRDWVRRYNAEGIAGLSNRPLPGRAPKLTEGQMASLKAIVLRGPDPAVDGVARWRIVICAGWSKSAGTSPIARPGCCACYGRSTCRTARPARFIRKLIRRRRRTSKRGPRRAPERDRRGSS